VGSDLLVVKLFHGDRIIATPRIDTTEIVDLLNDRPNTVIVKQVHFFTESGTFLESQPFTDEFLIECNLIKKTADDRIIPQERSSAVFYGLNRNSLEGGDR
jgi:hypothetical protein